MKWISWQYELFMRNSYECFDMKWTLILSWNDHMNFLRIQYEFSVRMENLECSYGIHQNFMNNFVIKHSWQFPNELFTIISYEYHDHFSTDRSHETFISNSWKFHEHFFYEIFMEIPMWTLHIKYEYHGHIYTDGSHETFIWNSWKFHE